eukprot:gene15298-18118_t
MRSALVHWLPFNFGKRIFLDFYLLTYSVVPTDYSPYVFFKFYLSSLATVAVVTVTCLVLRPYFSSTLLIRTSTTLLAKSRRMLLLVGTQIESGTRVLTSEAPPSARVHHDATLLNLRTSSSAVRATNTVDIFFPLDVYSYNTTLPAMEATYIARRVEEGVEFKEQLRQVNTSYSKYMSRLYMYLADSRKEAWRESLMPSFQDLAQRLERNHRILLSLHVSILPYISQRISAILLPLLPYINVLIEESTRMFVIMEKQLLTCIGHRHRLKRTAKLVDISITPDTPIRWTTLDESQRLVMATFESIDSISFDLRRKYNKLLPSSQGHQCGFDYELSRFHFFIVGIVRFAEDQKQLSATIYHISTNFCTKRHVMIACYIRSIFRYASSLFSRMLHKDHYPFPPLLSRVKFNTQEKVHRMTKPLIDRLLCEWRFSLRFAISVSLLSIGCFEIQSNSNFILFRNLPWFVITVTLVIAPTVGSSSFFSMLRIVGTIVGAFVAYGVAVLFSLPSNRAIRAVIFMSLTFVLVLPSTLFFKNKSYQQVIIFFVLTYCSIAFPMFTDDGNPSVIPSLLRTFHITMGVIVLLLVSVIIFPSYDYQKLETNLLYLLYDMDISLQLKAIRASIASQQALLFNARYELIFHQRRYHRYKDLVSLVSKLYTDIVSLEFISKLISDNNSSILVELKDKTNVQILARQLLTELLNSGHSVELVKKIESEFQTLFYNTRSQGGMRESDPSTFTKAFRLESLGSAIYSMRSFTKTFDLAQDIVWALKGVKLIKRVEIGTASQ